jgi:hypothetical protein
MANIFDLPSQFQYLNLFEAVDQFKLAVRPVSYAFNLVLTIGGYAKIFVICSP